MHTHTSFSQLLSTHTSWGTATGQYIVLAVIIIMMAFIIIFSMVLFTLFIFIFPYDKLISTTLKERKQSETERERPRGPINLSFHMVDSKEMLTSNMSAINVITP